MNQRFKFHLKCNVEGNGVVIEQRIWLNDESQAVHFFSELSESEGAIKIVSLHRWVDDEYKQMKLFHG